MTNQPISPFGRLRRPAGLIGLSRSYTTHRDATRARNDELGILPADAAAFLAACRLDGVKVLGWELWVVDHNWGQTSSPVPAIGSWCGGIPLQGSNVLAIVGGEGGVNETQKQLASFDFAAEVLPEWLPYVRVNFTLDG